MPFYEYQCSACEHHLEALQKISDAPLRKCPDCGRQTLKRLISAPVFRLKGGGWYETDFKSDKEQKRNIHGHEESGAEKSDSKADAGDGSKDKTSEAKPAEGAGSGAAEGSGSKSAGGSGSKSAEGSGFKPAEGKANHRKVSHTGSSKSVIRTGTTRSAAKPVARSKPTKAKTTRKRAGR